MAAVAGVTLVVGALSAISPETAGAQSAALMVNMSLEVPAGVTQLNLPTFTPGRLIVQVTNTGSTPVVNQPMVMRIANQPDVILTVSDGTGNVGIVDQVSGAWYHTVASIPAGAQATYALTFVKYCPGRWSIAVRIGDRLASSVAQWTGPADPRCGADELVAAPSPSFHLLPWPPTTPTSTTVSTVIATAATTTTTPLGGVGGPTTTSSSIVTTTRNPSTPPTLIQLTLGQSTASATTIKPAASSTLPLGATSSTVFGASTTRLGSTTIPGATTTSTRPGPTTTVVIFCKTISGTRYCAPLSSAYKPGQKKATELKPTTTKKKKKR